MKGYFGWLKLYSVHLSHSHSLNSSKREACRHRCMQAQTKKQTNTKYMFHFLFGIEHNQVFCGKRVKTDDIMCTF
jgi:hypothetical protein